jgi:hypothetical protein
MVRRTLIAVIRLESTVGKVPMETTVIPTNVKVYILNNNPASTGSMPNCEAIAIATINPVKELRQ